MKKLIVGSYLLSINLVYAQDNPLSLADALIDPDEQIRIGLALEIYTPSDPNLNQTLNKAAYFLYPFSPSNTAKFKFNDGIHDSNELGSFGAELFHTYKEEGVGPKIVLGSGLSFNQGVYSINTSILMFKTIDPLIFGASLDLYKAPSSDAVYTGSTGFDFFINRHFSINSSIDITYDNSISEVLYSLSYGGTYAFNNGFQFGLSIEEDTSHQRGSALLFTIEKKL